MKAFEYATPQTVEDALPLLAERWGKTELLAGGTDLVTCLKQGLTAPDRLVSLRRVSDLNGIEAEDDHVHIGAMTTLAELAAHATIRRHFPALVTAIEGIGCQQILNVGTVGGDLCQRPRCWYYRNGLGLLATDGNTSLVREGDNRYHAIFGTEGKALFVSATSLGPALIALGATLTVAQPKGGSREVRAADFFRAPQSEQDRETVLKPNEILTEVVLPIQGLRNATYEIRHRHGLDWPYVTASVAFKLSAGKASQAQVVLGHVAAIPWAARQASSALEGAAVQDATAKKAGEAATHGAKPLSRNAYKTQLVKTAVQRAILAAAGRA